MKKVKGIMSLLAASVLCLSLTGCSEKIFTEEEVKEKISYDDKIEAIIEKAANSFPTDSKTIFDKEMETLKSDLKSVFKNSSEKENIKLNNKISNDLKYINDSFNSLIKDNENVLKYLLFFDNENVSDAVKTAIKPIFEKSKINIESLEIELLKNAEELEKQGKAVLDGTLVLAEKDMNAYNKITSYYKLGVSKEYTNVYKEYIEKYKKIIDERYSVNNISSKIINVKTKTDRENIMEKVKEVITSELKSSGTLKFATNVTSEDIVINKSGSIYIIQSYVDVEELGTIARKNFTVKYIITDDYYMLISTDIQ